MKNGIERRQHPRVPIALPIVLKTPQGTIEGKTLNISVGGLAVLLFKEKPEIGDEFEITIKSSEDHDMLVTCEKLWSDDIIVYKAVYNGVGVRFTKISPRDLETITSMVEEYYII